MRHDMKVFMVLAFCMVLTFGLAACGGGGGGTTTTATGGASTLTAQSAADIINCPTGGVALDYGIDDNKDGVLDSGEVDGTEYICNGTDGLTALVATSPADIANCPAGGTRIEAGIDANSNNVLDPGEADPALTSYICNGAAPANTAPVADAGPDQTVDTVKGVLVTVDGSGSSDAEGPITTYAWSLVMRPAGSKAVLSDPSAQSPTFMPDRAGTYVLSLSVSDGWLFSAPDYVTIRARTWKGAELIDAGANNAGSPQVAFDADGNAFAVWHQHDGTYMSIYANRYDAGTGLWKGAVEIDAGANNAQNPQVAFDAGGNAIVVWRQFDGVSVFNIYANRYEAGTGWTGAELIETGANSASDPHLAVDANGNGVAVWEQYDGTYMSIYANRYDAKSGSWKGAELIDAGANNAGSPQVAVDVDGNAFAVWYQDDANWSIYANRYDAETGLWGGAGLIDAGDTHAYTPQVAFDASGNAFAVWHQYDGTYWSIYANRYDAQAGAWEGAGLIETGDNNADSPQVAFDADGNAVAVWVQLDGTYSSIYANRYDAATGLWGTAELIETDANDAYNPQVDVDASGNAFAVWRQDDGTGTVTYDIYANRYDAQSGAWGTAELIETGAGGTSSPQVAFDASGNAFAVWTQYDESSYQSIYANRYE